MIADDLTGALDAAAALAPSGGGQVLLGPDVAWPAARGVVAVTTRTRDDDEAATPGRVGDSVGLALHRGARVFLKIDSLLRGQVGSTVRAGLDAHRARGGPCLAVIAPAFPARGRTTRGGRVEVEGAQQPEQSDVVAALAEAGLRTAVIGSHDPLPEQAAGNSLEGRLDAVIVDCESDEDLARVAVRFAHRADVLLVGTAGLAAQLAPPAQTERAAEAVVGHRALLAIGSLAPAALGQVSALVSAGIAHVPVPAAPSGSGRHARELLRSGHVLLTPDPAIGRADPHAVARMLGDAVSEGVDQADLLVLSGGHTAQVVLDRLGVPLLEIVAELEPGVVASRMPGRPQLVVTKAGAFGDEAALLRLLHLPTTASLQERSAS